jgi:RHS repeat-associated protein
MGTARTCADGALGVVRWLLVAMALCAALAPAGASAAVPADAARSSYDDAGRLRSFVAPDAAGGARAPREAAVFEWDAVGNLLSVERYLASELSVIGVTPGAGQVGAEVTIAGTGFGDVARDLDVRFAGTSATVLEATDDELRVEVPVGASSGTVTVTRGLDTATSDEPFAVQSDQAPEITRASPAVLAAGGTLTIEGARFAATTGENDVWVNEARALVQSASASELEVEVPPSGSGRVRVETPDGIATGPDVFVVPSAYAPANVEDSGRLTLDRGRSVTLSGSGKVALFVVDARAKDRLRTLLAGSTMSGRVSVWSPTGVKLAEQTFSTGTSTTGPTSLAVDGTYTVLIEATSAGSVTLTSFVDVVSSVTPTSAGASRTVRTSFSGQHARLRFDGRAGQRIAVSAPSATLAGWIAIAPAGTSSWIGTYTTIGARWLDVRELPSDGEWDIWFESSGSSTGEVNATVYDVPADVTGRLEISPSVTRTEIRLDYAGQNASYQFEGRAGQRVLVRFSDIRLAAYDARVLTSGGSTVSSSSWTTSSTGYMEARLPSDGTYTLQVDPTTTNTGSVVLETSDASDVVEAITPTASGVARTVRTTYPAQDIRLRFDARAGQRFVVGVSGSTLSGYIQIARAGTNNFLTPWTTIAAGWLDLVTIPSDGSYDVWLETTGSSGGELTATVYDVPADLSESITLSTAIVRRDLRFDYPGQNARYEFDARAGQRVNVRFPSIRLAAFTARVVNAAGSTVSSSSFTSSSTHSLEALLSADGRYRVEVDPTGANTGETSVEIADAADIVESITPTSTGVSRSVSTSFTGQDVRLRFDARAGQRYVVGLSSVSGLSGYIEIARAGTTSYLNPWTTIAASWLDLVTIPSDGSYDVWLETTQSGGGSATVTVYQVPADVTDSFTLSRTVTRRDLTFDYVGQNAVLSFTGTGGQRVNVRFPTIRVAAFQARVVSSGGSTINSSSWTTSSTGWMEAVLPSNGTYSVVVDPTRDNTGSVSAEIGDASDYVETITPGSSGVTRTVTTTYPGQDARLRFTGTSGQEISVRVASSTIGGYLQIARAGTTSYLNPWTSFSMTGSLGPVTIPSNGDWDVWLETTSSAGGEATVTVTDVTEDGLMSLRSGQRDGQEDAAVGPAPAAKPSAPPAAVSSLAAPLETPAVAAVADAPRDAAGERSNLRAVRRAAKRQRVTNAARERATRASARAARARAAKQRRAQSRQARRADARRAGRRGVSSSPSRRRTARRERRSAGQRPTAVQPAGASTGAGLARSLERWDSPAPAAWRPNREDRRRSWTADAPASPWTRLAPLSAPAGTTALAGQVLRVDGMPLRSVTLTIEGTRTRARTDRTGRFLLAGGLEAGRRVLIVDGRVGGKRYGTYEIRVVLDEDETTELDHTIWLTELDARGDKRVADPTRGETVLTNPAIPGLEVRIPAGSRITSADGRAVRDLNLTAIPVDRPPFPLPAGTQVPTYFTAQPGGAYLSKGARIIYPNYHHLPPGHRVAFWQYDPDDRGWYVYGWGEVTRDGRQVVPDPGVRIWEFTGAMGTTSDPGPDTGPHAGGGASGGDPVDLGTGLFVYEKTDLTLPDAIPATVKRTYRPADSTVYGLGRGTTTPYDLRLWNVTSYTVVRMILPDGGTIDFDRTSPGTSWQTGVFEQRTTPGPWFGALIRRMPNVDGWQLHRRDGAVFEFASGYGPVTAIEDRDGNRLTIDRANGLYGVATRLTTEHGRWLRFTYDRYNRATQVVDNAGRRVSYTYDADSRLETVTDADGGVTTFTYDTAHRMTAIEDARGTTFLENRYGNGRVIEQTLANTGTYRFAYTLDGTGRRVVSTTVTDPRGMEQEVAFDADGLPVQDTRAAGTANEQVTRYERDATTNLVEAIVDPLGNRTELTYDTDSNVTEITRLADTADAVTTRFTYGDESRLLTRTDPLGRTTRYGYDVAGRLTTITDPTDRTTTLGYSGRSRKPAWFRDPGGNQTDLTYVGDELRSTTDPLGRTTTRWADSVGRVTAVTDPLGRTTRAAYSDGNLLTRVTDPRGATTRFEHDENGNLTTVTDARGKTMRATYDLMDDLVTWTDGNGRTETVERDLGGNVVKVTDRKGQVTSYAYDELNRRTFAGFGTTGSPGSETYDSTIDYAYDAGDRLVELDDSQAGVVANAFDGLDRLTSQTTPGGEVEYGYDDAGRRESLSLDGSSLAAYGYDDAGRLTSVAQGGQLVEIGHDTTGRPDTLELPGGIARTTTYDPAGQITRLTFTLDATPIGDLQYAYDPAGRRMATWGTLARFRQPAEIRSATYDDANRLVDLGGTTLRWDANGNLTDDGTRAYTWDSRDQLTAIRDAGGTIGTFIYDPLGRRAGWDIDSVQRGFVYDGWNVLKEENGGTDATLMSGLGLDHVFSRTVGATTRTVLADVLGSTVALADDRGAITDDFAYGPFGETDTTVTGHPYQYTGRENDATGLLHYRNRYYSPDLKRFISEDPIGMAGSGVNYYAYANGDPLRYTDPLGLIWTPPLILPINPFDVAEAAAPETGYNSLNVEGFLGIGLGFSFQISCNGLPSLGVNGGFGAGASISATHNTGNPTPGEISIVGGGTGGYASGSASVSTSDGSGGVGYGPGFGASASIGVGTTIGVKDNGC